MVSVEIVLEGQYQNTASFSFEKYIVNNNQKNKHC